MKERVPIKVSGRMGGREEQIGDIRGSFPNEGYKEVSPSILLTVRNPLGTEDGNRTTCEMVR